jgi:hypothetical protein
MAFDKSKSIMLTFNSASQLSLDEVKKNFKLKDDEIDAGFGVIQLTGNEYVVLVSEEAAKRISPERFSQTKGKFGNPKIGPFGPV